MFTTCKQLKSLPELPAIDLTDYCYHGMFMNCKGLTKAELPEAYLAPYAYSNMFLGSHNLNDVLVIYNENIDETNYKNWLNDVHNSGEFKYKGGSDDINISTIRNSYYVPENWNILKYENIILDPKTDIITLGADFVVYDTQDNKYKVLKRETYNGETFNTERYNTNYDIVIDIDDTTMKAVATDDAYGYTDMVNTDFATATSYFRIEIDTTTAGSFTTKISNNTYTATWEAGATMDSIKSQISNNNFVVLADGKGLGVKVDNISSAITLTDVAGTVTLIDMSKFAVYDKGVKYNDDYNETLEVINDNFKSWQYTSVQTIMGNELIPIGPNNTWPMNNIGVNTWAGINYTIYGSYCKTSGSSSFKSDGVNGSTVQDSGQVLPMKETVFTSNVNSSATEGSDAYKMYVYYNNLLNSNGAEFKAKHDLYESRYGVMEDLYGAYLMSHMVNTDNPTSGVIYTSKNYGPELTRVKGKIFTVTYDYKYYPAYPPEYNALQYGLEDGSKGFGKGSYYHPEPYDLAIMLRDDIMNKCNENFIDGENNKITKLSNSSYIGSCTEYNSFYTWNYYGNNGFLTYNSRSNNNFRSRPLVALPLD